MKLEDNYMKQVRKLHWLEHFHIIHSHCRTSATSLFIDQARPLGTGTAPGRHKIGPLGMTAPGNAGDSRPRAMF